MTTSKLNTDFIVEDPRTLRVVCQRDEATEAHVTWQVSFDPEHVPDERFRVVYATLHAGGDAGQGTINVGGVFTYTGADESKMSLEQIGTALGDSAALETLYDFARMNLSIASTMVDIDLKMPYKSPDPDVEAISDDDDLTEDEPLA